MLRVRTRKEGFWFLRQASLQPPLPLQTPYLKISENNTSVKWQGGKWTFQYTL